MSHVEIQVNSRFFIFQSKNLWIHSIFLGETSKIDVLETGMYSYSLGMVMK